MNWKTLRIAIVGPLPPPAGGMAGQTAQLADLLRGEGADVRVVATNAAYRPAWLAGVRGLRAVPRLIGYVARLWSAAGRVDVFHVMANSGWSWHLFAVPAIWIGRLRGITVVVNYRGGSAREFLQRSGRLVRFSLRAASALVVPSTFLREVFASSGAAATIVPNVVDVARFAPAAGAGDAHASGPVVFVPRNLEAIYDNETALRAFAILRSRQPDARLVVAGSGPEEARLTALAGALGLANDVTFTGRLTRDEMAARYAQATVVLNPSRVDNTPNSLLEALASGVPVVSTDVGGVPHLLRHEHTALLVPPADPERMAAALLRVLREPGLAGRLVAAGLADVQRFAWPNVRGVLASVYDGKHPRIEAAEMA